MTGGAGTEFVPRSPGPAERTVGFEPADCGVKRRNWRLAAEAVEDVEKVVGRAEGEIAEVTDADDRVDRSRVGNVESVNGAVESIVIGGGLARPQTRPHRGRRILLPALALAGRGRSVRALFLVRRRDSPRRRTRVRTTTTRAGGALERHRWDGRSGVGEWNRTRAEAWPCQRDDDQVQYHQPPKHRPLPGKHGPRTRTDRDEQIAVIGFFEPRQSEYATPRNA